MKIEEISNEYFLQFIKDNPLTSFYQNEKWGILKNKLSNTRYELLGFYDDEVLVGVSLVMYLKFFRFFHFAYMPQGFITDYNDFDKLKKITLGLKSYFKKKKIIFFKIDPKVIYRIFDIKLNDSLDESGKIAFDNLIKLKYRHKGFNKDFSTYQLRFNHRLDIDPSLDKLKESFSKSTIKNIQISKHKGVFVKEGTINDLRMAIKLFDQTSKRKQIISYNIEFYQTIMEEYQEDVRLYLVYIDPKINYENKKNDLQICQDNLIIIKEKMQKEKVGRGLNEQLRIATQKLDNTQKELTEAQKLYDKKELILIAALFSIKSNNEYISFTSGMNEEYKSFLPKYAMYMKHIEDAKILGCKYVNFYGVSGVFDKNDKDYGIYEIKKGFGGETIEYIGEFDFIVNDFIYNLYKIMR